MHLAIVVFVEGCPECTRCARSPATERGLELTRFVKQSKENYFNRIHNGKKQKIDLLTFQANAIKFLLLKKQTIV